MGSSDTLFFFMKQQLLKSLLVTVVGLLLATGASAITCSDGSTGQCFTYGDSGTILPYTNCVWTGRERDHCRVVGCIIRSALTYVGF